MNCEQWEERIAGLERDHEVDRHVVECQECRKFALSIEQSLATLREAHFEEIAPAHYTAVRARVLSRIDKTRRHWIWRLGLAVATLFALLYPALVREHETLPLKAPPVPSAAPPPLYVARGIAPSTERRRVARPVRRRTAEPLVVKMMTEDPNVVIYWISESGGE